MRGTGISNGTQKRKRACVKRGGGAADTEKPCAHIFIGTAVINGFRSVKAAVKLSQPIGFFLQGSGFFRQLRKPRKTRFRIHRAQSQHCVCRKLGTKHHAEYCGKEPYPGTLAGQKKQHGSRAGQCAKRQNQEGQRVVNGAGGEKENQSQHAQHRSKRQNRLSCPCCQERQSLCRRSNQ